VLRIYVAVRGWTPNCYAAHLTLFDSDPELGARLHPGFRLRSSVFEINTNSRGLRGPELTQEKPSGTKRIAILGGSSAFGYLVNDGEEAAQLLELSLRDRGREIEVINGGVPGYNLFRTRVRFQNLVAPLSPDIVLLYAGYNDVPYLSSDEPDREQFRQQAVAPTWERLLGNTVSYGFLCYRLVPPEPQFSSLTRRGMRTSLGQEQFRSNLAAVAAAADQSGARLVICSQATAAQAEITDRMKRQLGSDIDTLEFEIETMSWLRDELQRFALANEIPFIDVASRIPPDSEYLADLIHLTRSGEQRLADILATELEPLLDSIDAQ